MIMSNILELALTSEGNRPHLIHADSITTCTPTQGASGVREGDSASSSAGPLPPPMTPLEHINQDVLQVVLSEHDSDWSKTLFMPYDAVEEAAAELENSKIGSVVTSDTAANRVRVPSHTRSSADGSFDSGEGGEGGTGIKQTILR